MEEIEVLLQEMTTILNNIVAIRLDFEHKIKQKLDT